MLLLNSDGVACTSLQPIEWQTPVWLSPQNSADEMSMMVAGAEVKVKDEKRERSRTDVVDEKEYAVNQKRDLLVIYFCRLNKIQIEIEIS